MTPGHRMPRHYYQRRRWARRLRSHTVRSILAGLAIVGVILAIAALSAWPVLVVALRQ